METTPIGTVLIVDDEPEVRKILQSRLFGLFPYVETVSSGPEALERLRSNGVSLVIIDIVMPGMDGITLANKIKLAHPTMPLIFITGGDDSVRGRLFGDVWAKSNMHSPDDFARFITSIRKAIGIYALHQGIGETRLAVKELIAHADRLERRTTVHSAALIADGWELDELAKRASRRSYFTRAWDMMKSPAAHALATAGATVLSLTWYFVGDTVRDHAHAVRLAPQVQQELVQQKQEIKQVADDVRWIVRTMARRPTPAAAGGAP